MKIILQSLKANESKEIKKQFWLVLLFSNLIFRFQVYLMLGYIVKRKYCQRRLRVELVRLTM